MKYQFISKDIDTSILKYNDKEFEIKSTINLTSKMQGYIKQSRMQMIKDLAKDGMTVEDLIVEKEKNGKKYRDESNKTILEKEYQEAALLEVMDDLCLTTFNMKLADLLTDIGLEDENEISVFVSELSNKMMGKTPSGRN